VPDQEIAELNQQAYLWAADGTVDRYSQSVVAGIPTAVPCRWNQVRSLTTDALNNVVVLDATAVVDRDITIGSRMQLIPVPGGPDQELHIVKKFDVTLDLKGRAAFRQVGLMRLRNE